MSILSDRERAIALLAVLGYQLIEHNMVDEEKAYRIIEAFDRFSYGDLEEQIAIKIMGIKELRALKKFRELNKLN